MGAPHIEQLPQGVEMLVHPNRDRPSVQRRFSANMKSPAGRDSLDELCQAALWRACVDGGVDPCGPCPARSVAAGVRNRCPTPSAPPPRRRADPQRRRRPARPCTWVRGQPLAAAPPLRGSRSPEILRGSRTKVRCRAISGRSRVTVKKKRSAATEPLMLGARTPVCV